MNKATTALPKFGRAAEVRAASFDESDNTIEVVWTTGASVRRRDWRTGRFYNEILELKPGSVRLDRLNAGAPFLDTHDDWSLRSVIGAVAPGSAKVEGGKGLARVKLSRAPDDAAIVEKIRDGIIRNISVGYAIHRVEKTDADGDGQDDEWRVVDWEPLEISAVPVPADAGSQIRKADDDAALTLCEFITHRSVAEATPKPEASLADPVDNVAPEADITNDNISNQESRVATLENDTSVATPVVDEAATRRIAAEAALKAQESERKRAKDIRKLGQEANEQALAEELIDSGATIEEARCKIWDAMVVRANEPQIDNTVRSFVGTEHHEKRAALMGEALLHRADPTSDLSDGAREYRGLTLMDMAREALEVRGERTRGLAREEIAARALAQRSGAYGSTSDFPIILGNVVNTTLRAAYAAAPQTFRPLVREVSVSDFKAVNRAQLGEGPAFDKVNESGEFKRGSVVEGKETYKIATFGKVIAITRQVIVNDDMNAFGRIPQLLGGAAAQLESDLVWAQILGNPKMGDNVDLFHANHSNLPTAAAFSVASLAIARAAMAKQTGLDGKTVLGIRPSFLIVPVALETKAEQELHSTFYPDASDKVATASMRQLQIITEARLDNGIKNKAVAAADISGSAVSWYLSASPSQIDTVELAYLEGNRGIFTETRYGFDVDGVEVKGRLDVGAKVLDHRGLLKNAGA